MSSSARPKLSVSARINSKKIVISEAMQRNKSLVMGLKAGNYPVQINTQTQKYVDSTKKGAFSVERCIAYSVGKRLLSLKITEIYNYDRVNLVEIEVAEESGKGSCANFNLNFIRNNRYGVLSSMQSELSGSYDLIKKNYCVPPLPEAELVFYCCRETGDGSCFALEKKKSDNHINVVERVKCTHAFIVGDETLSVIFNIENDTRLGLRVVVDGPLKLKTDYWDHVFSRNLDKMDSEMLNNFATGQLPANNNYHPENNRTVVRKK